MRGEAGMSGNEEAEHYSIEDVEKCLASGFRLFKDALNTSVPTKAALIEIGIEELAKGFILLASIPKQSMDSTLNDLTKVFLEDISPSALDSLKKYNFSTFNKYNHKTKLQAIDTIFQSIAALYPSLEQLIPTLQDLFSQSFGQLGNIKKSDINDIVSKIPELNLRDMDEIKKNGFYVDFKDNKSISPEEQNLKTDDLVMIFFILYASLNVHVKIYKGFQLTDVLSDPKLLLGGFYDLLSEEDKNKFREEGK